MVLRSSKTQNNYVVMLELLQPYESLGVVFEDAVGLVKLVIESLETYCSYVLFQRVSRIKVVEKSMNELQIKERVKS